MPEEKGRTHLVVCGVAFAKGAPEFGVLVALLRHYVALGPD